MSVEQLEELVEVALGVESLDEGRLSLDARLCKETESR